MHANKRPTFFAPNWSTSSGKRHNGTRFSASPIPPKDFNPNQLASTITEPAFQISRLQPQFLKYCLTSSCGIFFIIVSELDMNLVVFIMCSGLYNMLNNAFQIVWLCNTLDVAGLPDYLGVPNFYIISKHNKINHNSHFGRFWEDLHENKKMYVLACQSVTSRDALLKSAATRLLFQFGILCDIIWKARVKIIDGLLVCCGSFYLIKKMRSILDTYCTTQIKQKRRDVPNRKSTSEIFEKLARW